MKKVIRRHESTGSMFRDPFIKVTFWISRKKVEFEKSRIYRSLTDQRGDVPGWVLVVLMTTGLVTAIWTIAAPRLTAILKNSLDAMNGIR
jgi:hypothetical protein